VKIRTSYFKSGNADGVMTLKSRSDLKKYN
jgi:hypothetical protein